MLHRFVCMRALFLVNIDVKKEGEKMDTILLFKNSSSKDHQHFVNVMRAKK